jgi:tetrapyrrole methylase family protein / MazG family protein
MKEFKRLYDIVALLRSNKGCPWDRKQKIKDYKNYLLEEVYELIEAIDNKNQEHTKEELGDVMLLVLSICDVFRAGKKFTVAEVLREILDKLVRRHPHVFCTVKLRTAEKVLENWTKLKNKEKKRKSFYEKIPKTLPALFYAYLIFKERDKIEKLRRPASDAVLRKEIGVQMRSFLSRKDPESYGQLLYVLTEWGAMRKLNPELVLLKKSHREAKKYLY